MKTLVILLGLTALTVGLLLGQDALVVAVVVAGPLAILLAKLWDRVGTLEREVAAMRRAALGVQPPTPAAAQAVPEPFRPEAVREARAAKVLEAPVVVAPGPRPLPEPEPELDWGPVSTTEAVASPLAPALIALRGFLTDGNLVVRVGILILFIGVAFLLKYAADYGLIPLPLRLGGVAIGGCVLLALGWRLRWRRRLYALLLQGAGIGVLFLTAFAAVRLFGLLGPFPALALMVVLVAATVVLAVAQDAQGLAGFGIAGGYLAPLLVTTGTGSHVILFGYYALFNVGVFSIAWFKAWKPLNLAGFLFTFGVGTLWGAHLYQPELFPTVEPFLLFNFTLYLAVAILFATRQPPQLRGLVDGTLVFGLPLAVFTLQGALVADRDYGLAWSALGLGLTYLVVAAVVWRMLGERLALLAEAWLAIAVAFLTIAIPLALDGQWSSALWAAEGAGLVWIGVRQSRVLARGAGGLLQLAAGLVFFDATGAHFGALPVLNGEYLGYLILALSGLFSSHTLGRHAGCLRPFEARLADGLLVWGGLWWLAGGVHETQVLNGSLDGFGLFLGFLAGSGLVAGLVARTLDWVALARAAIALLPLLWAMAWFGFAHGVSPHPFAGWDGLAWGLAFGVQWWLLYAHGAQWPARQNRLWHGATLWLFALLTGADLGWWGAHLLPGAAWEWAGWVLPAVLIMAGLVLVAERLPWPVRAFPDDYRGHHLVPIAVGLGVWVMLAVFTPVDPRPLPFLPLLNPVELLQVAVVALLWHWSRSAPAATWGLPPWIGLMALWVLSGGVAHAVHHLAGVAYTPEALFGSTLFQAALSIAWGVAALIAMWLANTRGLRPVWVAGAALLGLVVLKLFLVDLDGSGSVARIVSFIGVGVMMLAIGYLAPLPPRAAAAGVDSP